MTRPVTLFTGQWADVPLAELAEKCGGWGFDGLELACWGDHFDVAEALRDTGYAARVRALLERHGLGCWAIGNHLIGQAVCDPIDARHEAVLPPEVWGDGEPEGVRHTYLLVDRDRDELVIVGLWDDEAAANALDTSPEVAQVRRALRPLIAADAPPERRTCAVVETQ